MKPSDRDIDTLLARGRLGGPGRDAVLEHVLAKTAPRRRPAVLVWGSALLATAAVGAVVAMVALPERLRPKGAGPAPARLDLACAGGSLAACPTGATLVFGVATGSGPEYLAAFAEPTAGGERIWYFSAETVSGAPSGAVAPAPKGIRVGPEHAPG